MSKASHQPGTPQSHHRNQRINASETHHHPLTLLHLKAVVRAVIVTRDRTTLRDVSLKQSGSGRCQRNLLVFTTVSSVDLENGSLTQTLTAIVDAGRTSQRKHLNVRDSSCVVAGVGVAAAGNPSVDASAVESIVFGDVAAGVFAVGAAEEEDGAGHEDGHDDAEASGDLVDGHLLCLDGRFCGLED